MDEGVEEWREVPGYEGWYDVSSLGRVRSWRKQGRGNLKRHTAKILKPYTSNVGYLHVCLSTADGKPKHFSLHRLVLACFVGEPAGLEGNHKDGDKTNNRLDNLEYVTHRENIRHAVDILGRRLGNFGKEPPTDKDDEIRRLVASGMTQREVARIVGTSQPMVSYISRGMIRPEREG